MNRNMGDVGILNCPVYDGDYLVQAGTPVIVISDFGEILTVTYNTVDRTGSLTIPEVFLI